MNFQFSIFNFQKQIEGFSLIELMVVMTISALLVGSGLAAYSAFSERQQLVAAGQKLYNDLRFTQGKAAANEKPEGCGEGVLSGYSLVIEASDEYSINAECIGVDPIEVSLVTLPVGLEFTYGSRVMFYILGKGAEAEDFCIESETRKYKLSVSGGGEVIDSGLVETCP